MTSYTVFKMPDGKLKAFTDKKLESVPEGAEEVLYGELGSAKAAIALAERKIARAG